ncbi:MAG TPA: hypothetical protein VF627_13950, partial [Abditibacterium sp.]
MRLLSFLAACAWAFCSSASAQTAVSTDYAIQKAKLQAVRFDSLAELRVAARNYIGKHVELRGQVKGIFTRGAGLALMIQITEGETVVVEADESFRGGAATRPGVQGRF